MAGAFNFFSFNKVQGSCKNNLSLEKRMRQIFNLFLQAMAITAIDHNELSCFDTSN